MCNALNNTIVNSTISGNVAKAEGGGGGIMAVNCAISISHSTMTGNQASWGAGVAASDHAGTNVVVKNSIIRGNSNGTSADDVASENGLPRFGSLGYNLVGTVGLGDEFTETGDQVGLTDALLGVLQVNEPGTTATHALLTGSPAINAGTCTDHAGTTVGTDQRGVTRPQGGICDIGAFEVAMALPQPTFSCTFQRNPKKGQLAVQVAWANADPGVTRIQVVDGRTITKQQAPAASGTWSTSLRTSASVLTYGVWGGLSRKDTTHEWVAAGTSCSPVE